MSMLPFIKVAKGIPPNWPGNCVLRFDEEKGRLILSYYKVGEVEGITIDEWRALLNYEE